MRRITALIALAATIAMLAVVATPPLSAETSASSDNSAAFWQDTAVVELKQVGSANVTTAGITTSPTTGLAVLRANTTTGTVMYEIWMTDKTGVTQIGIFEPNGTMVANIPPMSANISSSTNVSIMAGMAKTGLVAAGNLTASDLSGPMQGKSTNDLITALKNGSLYIGVSTTQGEVRGQVNANNWWTSAIAVPMTPSEEPTLSNTSNAWGLAVFQMNSSMVHYSIWVFNITNVTQSHIHQGMKGVEGPVVQWLYPSAVADNSLNPAMLGPNETANASKVMNGKLVEGNITASDLVGPMKGMSISDLTTAMSNGSLYVNVHTTQNPGGEIRGQIESINLTSMMSSGMSSNVPPSSGSTPSSGGSSPSTSTPRY